MQLYTLDESQSTPLEDDKLSQSKDKTEPMATIEHIDLVGRSFLLDTDDGENTLRAQIVEAIQDHNETTKSHPEHIKFRCSVNEDQYEEILDRIN